MTTSTNATVRKPANFDLKKGKEFTEKFIRENTEWIKEMAKK